MTITVQKIKAGERLNDFTEAGVDMELWSAYGITADVFPEPKAGFNGKLYVPVIESKAPGSGMFGAFIAEMKVLAESREIVFVNVVNKRLARRLEALGIKMEDHELDDYDDGMPLFQRCQWCSGPCAREQERREDGLTLREECGCCENCEDARQAALKEEGEMDRADARLGE